MNLNEIWKNLSTKFEKSILQIQKDIYYKLSIALMYDQPGPQTLGVGEATNPAHSPPFSGIKSENWKTLNFTCE